MLVLSMDLGKFKTVCCYYETNWDSTRLLPGMEPEDVQLKVKRPKVRPAGELHSGPPKYKRSSSKRARKTKRFVIGQML